MFFSSVALVCRLRRYAVTVMLQVKKSYDAQYDIYLDGQSEMSAGRAQRIQQGPWNMKLVIVPGKCEFVFPACRYNTPRLNPLENKYRTISLLCNIPKDWEKMVEKTNAAIFLPKVDPWQYGFVPKRSTLLQLLAYTDESYRSLDSLTKFLATVYIDFAEAFDKLDHKHILKALHSTGILNKTVDIVRSYLDNQMERVKIGTKKTPELPVPSGVPQGSILGPLLFLVFVNSLPKVVTTSSTYMFPDDTEIMSSNPMELQEDLDRFVLWCDQSKMEMNVEKTQLMMFRGDDSPKIRMKNVNLQTSPFERDLGVVISEDLSWVEQTKTRCSKAYRVFFNLKRSTSPLSSLCSRLNMYCRYVVPILTHCSPVWHANRTSMKELELVQKRVTEWICRTSQVDYKTRLIQQAGTN